MSKLRMPATELTDTNVDFVALVKRGANRIPFRITKEDADMLDFNKLGRALFRKGEPSPAVVAVIVQKGVDVELVTKALEGYNFATFEKADKDGLVTFTRKGDEAPEGVILVKMNDDVAIAISHLAGAAAPLMVEENPFADVEGGALNSLSLAGRQFNGRLGETIAKAETGAEVADLLASHTDAYKAYVTKMAAILPVDVLKADATLFAVAKGTGATDKVNDGKGTGADKDIDDNATMSGAGDKTQKGMEAGPDGKGESQAGEGATQSTDQDTNRATGSATADDAANTQINAKPGGSSLPEGTQKSEDDPVMKALAALSKTMQESVSALQKTVDGLGKEVKDVAVMAKKAEDAVNGTVFNNADGDDVRTTKSEDGAAIPLLDTGFSRRSA